jgi:hypothetical protein
MHDMDDNDEKAIEPVAGTNRAAIINNCNRCHQNQSLTMIDSSPITAGEG